MQVIDLWLFLLLHHFMDVILVDGPECKIPGCGWFGRARSQVMGGLGLSLL